MIEYLQILFTLLFYQLVLKMADDWKSPAVRQRMVQQIAELLRAAPPQTKSAVEIENQVCNFQMQEMIEYFTLFWLLYFTCRNITNLE